MAIVVPELFAEASNAAMDHHMRIGKVAFDATAICPEITTCGDKIHFPVIDRTVTAAKMTKGEEITPAELSMTDSVANVEQCGSACRVYDRDVVQVKAAVVENLANQVGEAMADAIDKDLVAEMDKNAVYKVATANADAITFAEIEEGFDNFGDDIDLANYTIIINSRLRKSFTSMDQFVRNDYVFAKEKNGVGDADGVLGYYLGAAKVIVCNNDTFDTEKNECKTYIVKSNSLGIITQKSATIEEERESLKKAVVISADEMYAVKLLNPKGCAILRKTIA